VNLQTREPLEVEEARALLERMPGLALVDPYPTAAGAAGKDDVFVGRLRRDPSHERGLQMWVVSDNLRKGAATNAVQLAQLVHERGLVGVHTAA
jgi:aspartate-semialdehyde dehydrogenase